MAVDMFLKLSNDIKGESKDDKHKDEIDIVSWTWGLTQTGSGHYGGGSGAGKVSVQDLNFVKRMDSATPKLTLFCANGGHIDEGTLVCRKAGENPVEYFKLKMTEVFVTGIHTGGSQGEEIIHETVSLNFTKFNLEYTPQDEKGKAKAALPMGWDIAANKKL